MRFHGLGLMAAAAEAVLSAAREVRTDFIFANICEELGIIGALLIVGLFRGAGDVAGFRVAAFSVDRSVYTGFLAFGDYD